MGGAGKERDCSRLTISVREMWSDRESWKGEKEETRLFSSFCCHASSATGVGGSVKTRFAFRESTQRQLCAFLVREQLCSSSEEMWDEAQTRGWRETLLLHEL